MSSIYKQTELQAKIAVLTCIKCYLRVQDSIYRCEKANFSNYCESYYQDFKDGWYYKVLTCRNKLKDIANNFALGNINGVYYLPRNDKQVKMLKALNEESLYTETFAEYIESFYKNYGLDKEHPVDEKEIANLAKKRDTNKVNYVQHITDLSTHSSELVVEMVNKMLDKERKISKYNNKIKRMGISSEKKTTYMYYIKRLQMENANTFEKVLGLLPNVKNVGIDAWLNEF